MSKKQKKIIFLVALILVIIIVGSVSCFYATSHKNNIPVDVQSIDEDAELLELLNNPNHDETAVDQGVIQKSHESDDDNSDEILNESENSQITHDNDTHVNESVNLVDIYAENDDTVVFKCFDNSAQSYEWEYYNCFSKTWTAADISDVLSYEDELHRKISGLKVKAEESVPTFMVRCTMHYIDREDEIQTASLFILPDRVKKIAIEDITVDANTYLSTRELPVQVTYIDGTDEIITGLNNLYFISSEEKKDHTTTISGNRMETITLTTTECDYQYIGLEEQEQLIRYHPDTSEDVIEAKIILIGKDLLAPIISDIEISPYEISSVDEPITLSISISADDNVTPYPYLEYAFLYSDQEPADTDWMNRASFDVCIERNGTYIVYVRDKSGNIAQLEKEIITVDTKAPVISSILLSNETGWCKSNTIIVNAKDAGEIRYSFRNMTDGTYSDWITYNEYFVENNGIWVIQVKDAVGNISEAEITINNIDKEAPTIQNISIK